MQSLRLRGGEVTPLVTQLSDSGLDRDLEHLTKTLADGGEEVARLHVSVWLCSLADGVAATGS
jgi:hypothetical protein